MSSKIFPHFNTRVGSQTFDPKYYFTEEGPLVETAKGLYEMGADVIKFSLSPKLYNLPINPSLKSFKDIACSYPDFRTVLDMPFKYFMIWVINEANGRESALDIFLNEEKEHKIYSEIYNLTSYLLTTYNDSGKVFLIGNWESDWVLLDDYDASKEVDDSRIEGMIRNLTIRQKAVEDARRKILHKNVWVGHYAEVNRPLDAKDRQLKRMTNCVLPNVILDMVSYSSYDSLWPNRTTEALSYIEENSRFTAYFDELFKKKVFIGEYDGYWDFVQYGYCPTEKQAENALSVISSGIAWGAPFILYWEFYSNGLDNMREGEGFWLVDRDNQKQPVYYLHKEILAKINVFKNLYRYWLERNPEEDELNRAIGKLYKNPISVMVKELLNSDIFRWEISDEKYVSKIICALFEAESEVEDKVFKYTEQCKKGISRFQILLKILDSSEFCKIISESDFKKYLHLDKLVSEREMIRSELWIYYLDRKEFLLKELSIRQVSEKKSSLVNRKYLF